MYFGHILTLECDGLSLAQVSLIVPGTSMIYNHGLSIVWNKCPGFSLDQASWIFPGTNDMDSDDHQTSLGQSKWDNDYGITTMGQQDNETTTMGH